MLLTKNTLFTQLHTYLPENPIIVEAGAFNGGDTKKLSAQWPKGTVYAFEPVPAIFKELEKTTAHLPNVIRYPFALSDTTGTATFHMAHNPQKQSPIHQAGSLLAPKERLSWSPVRYTSTIEVATITLEDWVTKNGISVIDFMWLDAQGHELAIIKSAGHYVHKIRAIYTEVSFVRAYENGNSHKEIEAWLLNQGFYEAGRDFTNTTSWFYGNVLYVNKNFKLNS